MNILILFPKILLLYSGWIIIIMLFFRKKLNFIVASIILFVTQMIFSFITINSFDYFKPISFSILLLSVILGAVIFILEYLIGRFFKKVKSDLCCEINLGFVLCIFLLPISEEIYFRVFIYELIKELDITNINLNIFFILLSALVLTINHFQTFFDKVILFQKFFIEGLLLSIVFVFQKNIWVVIIVHEIFNCLNLVYYYKIGGVNNE